MSSHLFTYTSSSIFMSELSKSLVPVNQFALRFTVLQFLHALLVNIWTRGDVNPNRLYSWIWSFPEIHLEALSSGWQSNQVDVVIKNCCQQDNIGIFVSPAVPPPTLQNSQHARIVVEARISRSETDILSLLMVYHLPMTSLCIIPASIGTCHVAMEGLRGYVAHFLSLYIQCIFQHLASCTGNPVEYETLS